MRFVVWSDRERELLAVWCIGVMLVFFWFFFDFDVF